MTFNVIASRVYISIHALLAESDSSKTHDRHKTTISIHALLAESDNINSSVTTADKISIHALLAESDRNGQNIKRSHKNFYPRSPCGERLPVVPAELTTLVFLSTLSLRRATFFLFMVYSMFVYFYPRSPCGERQGTCNLLDAHRVFLSTLSLRRATCCARCRFWGYNISIHALLAESDLFCLSFLEKY